MSSARHASGVWPRPRIDQIERIALERRARDLHRIERFLRGVQPAELLQRRIIERLHAERDAIDAGRAVAAKTRRLDAGRIGLERDFDVGRDRPVLADRIEDRADRRGLHQRRRAAAHEDGRDRAGSGALGRRGDLAPRRRARSAPRRSRCGAHGC